MALEESGLKLIADGVSAYLSDINKADKANEGFYKTLGDAPKHAGAFQQVITGALRHVGASLVEFAAQGAKAIGGFVKDSIDLAGDFESGMLEFQSVAGKEVDTRGLEEFRDLFLQIGKELPVSTSDVQKAATEMIKGGIDPAALAAGALEQNIQFAAAAMGGDLVKAAEISSKIMGGWAGVGATAAEKAEFLTHATDMLTKAANASATDVEGLSQGIFNAQGIARTAGVSFDDLTTTLATLAPRFASSSEAGNSLKNMIARLQPTTDPATQAMQALGLYTEEAGSAFYDAQGNFVGFQQASQLLQDSLKGLTKEQQAATLQQIFGNDAMGSAAALAELGAAGYQNMADALANANGVADAAALKQQGFNVSLDNAKGSVEALQITIGSFLLPILGDLLDNYIAPTVNAITSFAEKFFELVPAIQASDDPLQSFLNALKVIAPNALDLIGAVEGVKDAISQVIGWFDKGGAQAQSLGGAVGDLNGIWAKALSVITDVMGGYQAIAQAVLPIVTRFVDEHGDEIAAFFKATWASIVQIVTLALDVYQSIVPPILHGIADFITEHGSEISKILGGAWEMITSIITGALETIKGVLKLALDLIHGDWDAAWKDIEHIVDVQAQAISGFVSGFFDVIAGLFDTSMAEIGQTWADNWAMLVNIATETDWAQVGQDVVDGIVQGLSNAWSSLVDWIVDQMGGLVGTAIDAIDGGSPAMKFAPVGQSIVQGIMQGVSDHWGGLTSLIGSLSADLIDEMESIAEQVQGVIADAFGATASIDRQIASNLDKLKDVLPAYRQYTEGALSAAAAEARQFADPAQGAKYFALRSKQILEYAKLQQDLAEAETQADKDRIAQQMLLINAAQTAELSAFRANQQGQSSPQQDIANQINAIIAALADPKLKLTDEQLHYVDMLSAMLDRLGGVPAPGRAAGGPVAANTPYWVGESGPELFMSKIAGQIMAPQSQPMNASAMGGNYSTTNSQTTNLSMPIYTNQSPSVLRDSMAIAGAALL